MRAPARVLVLLAAVGAACSRPAIDLTKALQVTEASTGWLDAGLVNGNQNKLVPSISLQLKNVSDQTLTSLQVNAVFRRVTETQEWGSQFLMVAGSEGLAPRAASRTLVISSPLGYTGTEPRLDIMKNSQFVDAKVQVFAKYGSTQWTRLEEFPITRQLIEK